jgi:hypothetical protein
MLFFIHSQARHVEYVRTKCNLQKPVLTYYSPALIVGNFLPIIEATPGPLPNI